MEKVVQIFKSFAEAEAAEIKYWQQLDNNKKLEILEGIRLQYYAWKNVSPRRFQRVYRIIKRKLR